MSVLQLVQIPDELLQRLERLAARDRRTPAEAAVALLDEALRRAEDDERTRIGATLQWIRDNRITPAAGSPDSTDLLREDRER